MEKTGLTYFNMVSTSLRASKLSRELELPQYCTVGRYERAIRIADKYGTLFQKFLARYEYSRTLIYWFDQIEETHNQYDEMENLALKNRTSHALELLGCILAVLTTYQCNFKNLDFQIVKRSNTLRTNLLELACDKSRPNESLHARTLLAINELKTCRHSGKTDDFDKIFGIMTGILEESRGLGEYRISLIIDISNELANIQINGKAYDNFVSTIAKVRGERRQEGEQGKVFLRRGQQCLKSSDPSAAINWLGKASIALNKAEDIEQQIEATFFLTLAYARINLNWAARATILSCLCSIKSISDKTGVFHHIIFEATEVFCIVCLQLGHLPDALHALHLLRLFETHVTVPKDEAESYAKRFENLEASLTCALVSLDESHLKKLAKLPEILEALCLYSARQVLLFRLKNSSQMKQKDNIESEEVEQEEMEKFMDEIATQANESNFPNVPILNDEANLIFRTNILFVDVEILSAGDEKSVSICENLITCLEAFTANLFNSGVYPSTSFARVSLETAAKATNVEVDVDPINYMMTVRWPDSLDIRNLSNAGYVQQGMLSIIISIIELISITDDQGKKATESLESNKILERSMIFSNTNITHGLIFNNAVSKITDLDDITTTEKTKTSH